MRGERALLRLGEYLVGRACRRLPPGARDERYREWAAELPAILHDREIRFAPYRAVRMLGYAADTLRGTALTPGRPRPRAAVPLLLLGVLFIAALVGAVWSIWITAHAPGHAVNYVRLAWFLMLVAWSVSEYARPAAGTTQLISMGGSMVGVVVFSWEAAQAPGDWVNYMLALLMLSLTLAWWLVRRWVRTGNWPALLTPRHHR
jgi:hypothetical protein